MVRVVIARYEPAPRRRGPWHAQKPFAWEPGDLHRGPHIPKPKSRRNFFRAVFSFLIESPFTQTMRVALAALCNFYDPGGNDLLHDLFRVPEAVNVIHCLVVSIRHHLNVCRFMKP
jgi:hypothetical protein